MKKLMRILPILIALSLVCSLTAGAVSFSDLKGHWSESYMMDLYQRGYMKGYDDGRMGPDDKITCAEALVLLSRVFETDEASLELLNEEYGEDAQELIPAAQSWMNDEDAVVICLASGVISTAELKNMVSANALTQAIAKEYLAALFVRAMQLEEKAKSLSAITLNYSDVGSISASYLPYVQVFTDCGIVQGDDENSFAPKSSVTRAVAATMLSRTLSYLEAQDGLPELSDFVSKLKIEGIIAEAASGSVTITNYAGVSYAFQLEQGAEVTVNGAAKNLSTAYVGDYAKVYYDLESGYATSVAVDTSATWASGKVQSYTTTTSTLRLVLADPVAGGTTTYTVASNVKAYYEDAEVSYSSIAQNRFATVKIVSGKVAEIYTYDSSYELEGTLTNISYGTTTILSVLDQNDRTVRISLDIANLPTVKRGEVSYENGLNKLKVGDELTITVKQGVVTQIYAPAQEVSASGQVLSITQSVNGLSIIVQDAAGGEGTYVVSPSVEVSRGDSKGTIADLNVGDVVSLVMYDGLVTDIKVTQASSTAGSVSGTVQYVDLTQRQVILLIDGNLVYVQFTNNTTLVSSAGGTAYLVDIKVGDYITAYGSYDNSLTFKATTVLVIK